MGTRVEVQLNVFKWLQGMEVGGQERDSGKTWTGDLFRAEPLSWSHRQGQEQVPLPKEAKHSLDSIPSGTLQTSPAPLIQTNPRPPAPTPAALKRPELLSSMRAHAPQSLHLLRTSRLFARPVGFGCLRP